MNSPDKEYDFLGKKSDEDSVASGDDSIGWEAEAIRVMNSFEQMGVALDAKEEAALQEDAAVPEMEEWELIAEGGEDAGVAHPADAPPQVRPFEIRKVVFKTTVLKLLKAIAFVLKASGNNGTKRAIFDRLRDLPAVQKISDNDFHYRQFWRLGLMVLLVWSQRQRG